MLGYAVLFFMHEQGMERGPLMTVVYDEFAKEDDVSKLVERAIDITGVYDDVRYNHSAYKVLDVSKLHHQIALDIVDKDTLYDISRIAPELYQYAKNASTGTGGSMIRKTIGWDQFNKNRTLMKSIIE